MLQKRYGACMDYVCGICVFMQLMVVAAAASVDHAYAHAIVDYAYAHSLACHHCSDVISDLIMALLHLR
jgi:hypothetical protein